MAAAIASAELCRDPGLGLADCISCATRPWISPGTPCLPRLAAGAAVASSEQQQQQQQRRQAGPASAIFEASKPSQQLVLIPYSRPEARYRGRLGKLDCLLARLRSSTRSSVDRSCVSEYRGRNWGRPKKEPSNERWAAGTARAATKHASKGRRRIAMIYASSARDR